MLASLPEAQRAKQLASLTDEEKSALRYHWPFWARPEQLPPDGPWVYWAIIAGRGFGKTRTGAEWVRQEIRSRQYVNLIGATADDARDIMIEGESGILACCPAQERPTYKKHLAKLEWPNGAESLIFTADQPERLRGKQHMSLWADEMAAWRYQEAWDQAKFGLRLGPHPRACITTTPRAVLSLRELMADPATHITRGSTYANRSNLAEGFFADIIKKYEGTRLGRQELEAEILDDVVGALWQRAGIDEMRVPPSDAPPMRRIVIAVDPAISSEEYSNETGIIAAGSGDDNEGYVLSDASGIYSPDQWARQAVALFNRYDADCIVAEGNQGGDMVAHTLRSVAPNVPVKMVHASRGKVTRAEPVAALYEQGRVHHVGRFDTLEDQMCAFTSDFDRKAMGYSPDRVDALVWAFTELFPTVIKRERREFQRHMPKARFF